MISSLPNPCSASTCEYHTAAAFWEVDQVDADPVIEMIIEAGVNYIGVSPSYAIRAGLISAKITAQSLITHPGG
jgi:hypothetical protein